MVIRGAGIWRIGDEEVQVSEGSFIRFDPETTRCPVAGPEGMTFISIGVRPGAYEPPAPSEPSFERRPAIAGLLGSDCGTAVRRPRPRSHSEGARACGP